MFQVIFFIIALIILLAREVNLLLAVFAAGAISFVPGLLFMAACALYEIISDNFSFPNITENQRKQSVSSDFVNPHDKPNPLPAIVSIILSIIALGHWPYGYYIFLRWVVCASGFYLAFKSLQYQRSLTCWIFVAVSVLFNPVLPFRMQRESWEVFNVVAVFVFVGSFFLKRNNKDDIHSQDNSLHFSQIKTHISSDQTIQEIQPFEESNSPDKPTTSRCQHCGVLNQIPVATQNINFLCGKCNLPLSRPTSIETPSPVKAIKKTGQTQSCSQQPSCEFEKGLNYYNAKTVSQNYIKAFECFQKAACSGSVDAQYYLGIMFADGEGVDQNNISAMKWLSKASVQGHEKAKELLHQIQNRLREIEIEIEIETAKEKDRFFDFELDDSWEEDDEDPRDRYNYYDIDSDSYWDEIEYDGSDSDNWGRSNEDGWFYDD